MLHLDLIAPVSRLLERHAKERPEQVAYSDSSRAITYAQLAASTAAIAASLAQAGVRDGDRVAIYLPNGVDWVEACLAGLRAGAVIVPISFDAVEGEISYRLSDAGCTVVVTAPARKELIGKIAHEAGLSLKEIYAGEGASQAGLALADLASSGAGAAPLDPDDIDRSSFIIYTSGTTGRAKGVLLSVRGMLWITAACWSPICGLNAQDVVLSPLPLFHSYGLNLSVLSVLAVGASEHIMEKFSPQQALDLMQSGRYTVLPGVPTMFHYLLHRAQETNVDRLGSIRLCISAGAIMPATLNRTFEERFGIPLLDGYGITETSTMVTMNWLRGGRPSGSCGLPVPGLAVRIVDPVSRDVPLGEEGELIVRGPNLMQGYHNKSAETASALRHGWYHTGDLARSDPSGYLTITGRIKELIIRGGQNIAPAEIEELVLQYPNVTDCAVVAARHATLGEVPCLFIVAKPHELDVDALMQYLRAHLSSYKIPEVTHFIAEIPRTGSGKIMRYKLVEALQRMS
jgi:long-chain acyl-CoA synthetase